jgi:membrane protease YdiL (CAAX protease family)
LGLQGARGEQVAVQQLKLITHSEPLLISMMITIIGIVPILEELLFRGFLQSWLREKLSMWLAIPIASLLFAVVHFSKDQGLDNLELIASLFVLSCFLGYLFERQKSLWASIGLHSGFNLISAFMIIWRGE